MARVLIILVLQYIWLFLAGSGSHSAAALTPSRRPPTPQATSPPPPSTSPPPSSSVIVNTLEGYTLAFSNPGGRPRWRVKTGPPLVSSTFRVGENAGGIVPGVDGSLFALNSHGLQRFPVSTKDLLRKSFLIEDSIVSRSSLLVGNKKSSMFALHPDTGDILDKRKRRRRSGPIFDNEHIQESSDQNMGLDVNLNLNLHPEDRHYDGVNAALPPRPSHPNRVAAPLLLHRIEYTVHNVDTLSGEETWNMTLAEVGLVYDTATLAKRSASPHCSAHGSLHVECTHDGVVRVFQKKSPARPLWETRISGHPQSCHIISDTGGVEHSFNVFEGSGDGDGGSCTGDGCGNDDTSRGGGSASSSHSNAQHSGDGRSFASGTAATTTAAAAAGARVARLSRARNGRFTDADKSVAPTFYFPEGSDSDQLVASLPTPSTADGTHWYLGRLTMDGGSEQVFAAPFHLAMQRPKSHHPPAVTPRSNRRTDEKRLVSEDSESDMVRGSAGEGGGEGGEGLLEHVHALGLEHARGHGVYDLARALARDHEPCAHLPQLDPVCDVQDSVQDPEAGVAHVDHRKLVLEKVRHAARHRGQGGIDGLEVCRVQDRRNGDDRGNLDLDGKRGLGHKTEWLALRLCILL